MRISDWSSDVCSSDLSEVQRNRHRLRRDQAAEFRFARKRLIPVDRIGIVHRHYPATDIARRARVPELTPTDQLPDAMIDVTEIELRLVRFFGGTRHLHPPVIETTTDSIADNQQCCCDKNSEGRRYGKECVRKCRSRGAS